MVNSKFFEHSFRLVVLYEKLLSQKLSLITVSILFSVAILFCFFMENHYRFINSLPNSLLVYGSLLLLLNNQSFTLLFLYHLLVLSLLQLCSLSVYLRLFVSAFICIISHIYLWFVNSHCNVLFYF